MGTLSKIISLIITIFIVQLASFAMNQPHKPSGHRRNPSLHSFTQEELDALNKAMIKTRDDAQNSIFYRRARKSKSLPVILEEAEEDSYASEPEEVPENHGCSLKKLFSCRGRNMRVAPER